MTFALIYDGIVMNRFEGDNYEEANILARASHGNEAFAVNTDRYSTAIGDKYIDGTFYKLSNVTEDGEWEYSPAPYIPTELDRIIELEVQLEKALNMNEKVVEEKTILENKVVQLQQLMSEIYEKTEV